jgi:hypothetical protein
MIDKTKPEPAPIPAADDVFMFPRDVVEKWIAIPGNQPLLGPLTKDDLDHLLFSTSRIASAVEALHLALVAYSQGNIDEANAALGEAASSNMEGENHMRKLFFAIMRGIVTQAPEAAMLLAGPQAPKPPEDDGSSQ